ncbi:class I SAM-dependent methyltransferase [Polynucleobacter paneuropaeus]|nr:class I SAM-dependent methyltransferase [Polynucleobacter paneuropaeus]
MPIRRLVRNFLKKFALFLSDIELLPKYFDARIKVASIFRNKQLQWNSDGYWFVTPMPSHEDLDYYYSNIYWDKRGGKNSLVEMRDMNHWLLLVSNIQELKSTSKKLRCLNFGAGHGGISYLLFAMGHEVVNVEPSGLPMHLGSRWITFESLNSIKGEFDLIYGSHSLEHVQNLNEFMSSISRHLKPEGYVFFEVPNCRQSNCKEQMNGGQNGKLAEPHTYYFTIDYFKSLNSRPVINSTYYENRNLNDIAKDEDGGVIRYLGQGKPVLN